MGILTCFQYSDSAPIGRSKYGSLRAFFAFAFVLSLLSPAGLVLASPENDPSGSLQAATTEREANARLDAFIGMVRAMRGVLAERGSDLESVLERADYEAQPLIDFVQSEVRLDIYDGALRGARSTLLGRAGNTLDQSLLLATLLKEAGFDARIAGATLSAQQAQLVETQAAAPNLAPEVDTQRLRDTAMRYAPQIGLPDQMATDIIKTVQSSEDVEQTPQYAHAQQQLAALRGEFKPSVDPENHSSGEVPSAMEATRYYWVQYKTSAAEPWRDAHTIQLDNAGQMPVAEEIYSDELPPEIQHRFAVEFYIEQEVGGHRQKISLNEPWNRPSANLDNAELDFAVVPLSMLDQDSMETLRNPSDRIELFTVVFNGQTLANGFDVNGNVIPLDALGAAYAALFATVSDKVNLAAGALSGLGAADGDTPKRLSQLARVGVSFTFTEPDGTERVFDRVLFDRAYDGAVDADAGRPSNEAMNRLTAVYDMRVATGFYSEYAVLWTLLNNTLDAESAYRAKIAERFESQRSEYPGAPEEPQRYLTQLFGIFDSVDSARATYRTNPHLLIKSQTTGIYGGLQSAVDIVWNPRRARDDSNHDSILAQGVWESVTEGVFLVPEVPPRPIVEQFEAVRSAQALSDLKDHFSTAAYENALADLRRGYSLLVPADFVNRTGAVDYWWRLEPGTELLRILSNGTGGEETEYLTQQQIAQKMTCVVATTAACRSAADLSKPLAYVQVMEKNAKFIDTMIDVGNALFDIAPLPPDQSSSGATGAAAHVSNAAILKASEYIFKKCIEKKMPQCAVK